MYEDYSGIIVLIILIITLFFIVNLVLADLFSKIANDKGYGVEAHPWAMCFGLGLLDAYMLQQCQTSIYGIIQGRRMLLMINMNRKKQNKLFQMMIFLTFN